MSFTEKFIIFILLLTMSTMILSVLCSAVAEAVTNAVKPLIDMIHRQGETITCLQQDNTTLRQDNANLIDDA
jgi:chromosome condensin MukBEF MukE localization factor